MGLVKHPLTVPDCVLDDGSRHSKPVQLQNIILIATQSVVKIVLLKLWTFAL